MRLAGADDTGVAGDGVFDVGIALDNLVGDGLKQGLTMFGVGTVKGFSQK